MTPGLSLPANTSGRSSAPQAMTMAAARTVRMRWRGTPCAASATPGAERSITPTVLPSYTPNAVERVSMRTLPVACKSANMVASHWPLAPCAAWPKSAPPSAKSCSTSITCDPARAACKAALKPAAPEPITSTSV